MTIRRSEMTIRDNLWTHIRRTGQSMPLALAILVTLSATTMHADVFDVSDQASCEALPIPVTWDSDGSVCQFDANFDLFPGDSLTVDGVAIFLPSGRTLTNTGGLLTVRSGGRLLQQGTVINQVGGQIVDRGFWDARESASISNFPLSTIEVINQLQIARATLTNFGVLNNSGTISIGRFSTLVNSFAGTLVNDHEIRVSGRLENNSNIFNNRDIVLDCDGVFENNGTLTGTAVDEPFCTNGGDWSQPSSWNKNVVPPSGARIIVDSGISRLDIDLDLTGRLFVHATLVVEPGISLTNNGTVNIPADFLRGRLGELINQGNITNNETIFNNWLIRNDGDFLNLNTVDIDTSNGRIQNFGMYENSLGAFTKNGIDNESSGRVHNLGIWQINRSNNTNRGTLFNFTAAVFRLNNTLVNKSGGLISNFGIFNINHPLNFPGKVVNEFGALFVTNFGGVLNIAAVDSSLDNFSEVRHQGLAFNTGIINNQGRFCGGGEVNGNPVSGNAPEPVCNRPPTAVASPKSAVFECSGITTPITLDGRSSSDPDLRDPLSFQWSPGGPLADASSALTSGNFSLGDFDFGLTVTDSLGEMDSDTASFTLRDTTPAELVCPADVTVAVDDVCQATVDPGIAAANDVCETDPQITRSPSGTLWPLGRSVIEHTAIDLSGNQSMCTSVVEAIDETLPAIQCNTEGAAVRPGLPSRFEATANDNCSVSSVSVASFDCWQINRAGKRVDKTDKCVVELSGPVIDILEPSGPGTIIGWTVEATDGSGNVESVACQVVSQRPTRRNNK